MAYGAQAASRRYQWIGWDDENDTAVVLIAPDREAPTIWFNHRLVHGSLMGWVELWTLRRLQDGSRFAVLTAPDLDVLRD